MKKKQETQKDLKALLYEFLDHTYERQKNQIQK